MTVTDSRPGGPPRQDEHRLSRSQRKAIVAGAVGNTVEWVDWAVYATFAPIFADRFFPPDNGSAALLATLAVFAVGFVMRPIGGAVLGAYSDRHGRKKGMTLTIALMAGSSSRSRSVRPIRPSASRPRSCWSSPDWSRASPRAASSVRPPPSWWSPPPRDGARSPGPGSRSRWARAR